MPSRTSSTKLRTCATRPPALSRADAAMPSGVNALARFETARTTSAPTASPTPSHSRRFIVHPLLRGADPLLPGAAPRGPALFLELGPDLGLLVGLAPV